MLAGIVLAGLGLLLLLVAVNLAQADFYRPPVPHARDFDLRTTLGYRAYQEQYNESTQGSLKERVYWSGPRPLIPTLIGLGILLLVCAVLNLVGLGGLLWNDVALFLLAVGSAVATHWTRPIVRVLAKLLP